MSIRYISAIALALAIAGMVPRAQAESSPFVGQWHWNRKESTAAAGEPLPQDVVLKIGSAEAAHVQWTLTTVDDEGEQHVETFSGSGDGKPAAIGGGAEGTTGAFTLKGETLDGIYANPDGSSDHSVCTTSANRKKMTCRGTETDSKGNMANYIDVYDRQ